MTELLHRLLTLQETVKYESNREYFWDDFRNVELPQLMKFYDELDESDTKKCIEINKLNDIIKKQKKEIKYLQDRLYNAKCIIIFLDDKEKNKNIPWNDEEKKLYKEIKEENK